MITQEQTLELIQSHNAAVKLINDSRAVIPADDILLDARWTYHIDDLADPFASRKVSRTRLKEKNLVKVVYNFGLHQAVLKNVAKDPEDRLDGKTGQPYKHTLKTSISLLPPAGRMTLFTDTTFPAVGLIYHLGNCDLRGERYVFSDDATTYKKWWMTEVDPSKPSTNPFGPKNPVDEAKRKIANAVGDYIQPISLDALRELHRKAATAPNYNEILAGVSMESVYGVFYSIQHASSAPENLVALGLIAQSRRRLLLSRLGLDVPIFRIGADCDPTHYSDSDARKDRQVITEGKELAQNVADILAGSAALPKNTALEKLTEKVKALEVLAN